MNAILRYASLLIASLAVGASLAQDYPSKPVRIVVPFSPGGSTDVLARIVGQKLTERSGQLIGDLLAGQVQLASMGLPVAVPHVQSGKLRAIAVTGAARSPLLPEVPTVSEAGLPGFEVTSWYGVFGPAGLPADIVVKLNAEIGSAVTAPEVKERLAALGAEPSVKAPDQFARYVRQEITKWAKVVKESGAKAE